MFRPLIFRHKSMMFRNSTHEEKGRWDESAIAFPEANMQHILFSCLSPMETPITFLRGYVLCSPHPPHTFYFGLILQFSSCSAFPFLIQPFLPPCPAMDLSWWSAPHLLLPFLEPTLSTDSHKGVLGLCLSLLRKQYMCCIFTPLQSYGEKHDGTE